jgi:hypothetical protein
MVSRSTFFSHQKKARMDGDVTDNSSDADDDDSDIERERQASLPLAPFAPAETSAVERRRASPYRRSRRTASPDTSGPDTEISVSEPLSSPYGSPQTNNSANAAPTPNDGAAPTDIDGESSNEVQLDVDGSDANEGTPNMSPPPTSPPPSSSSEEDPDPIDDIEHVLFSNFDIEDLLYAGQIEVQPWIRLGIVLLRWKSKKNISTHAYNELRRELAKCLGIKVPSARVTIRHLQEIVGMYPVKIDCCTKGCLAYVGRYRRGKKCAICGAKRYQADRPGDEDFSDVDLDDSELSDGATYEDDLDANGQVSYVVRSVDIH